MIRLFRFLDTYIIWSFVLLFFWLKYLFVGQKKRIVTHPKKILVIRLRALWSSLLTFPMIKQLEDYYGKDVEYDLLATSRNIWVFKNQWYFHQMYNLFSMKGFLRMLWSFKKYDIVIDAEEYFRISSLISLRTGKITVGYGNIAIRKLAYVFHYIYSEKTHNLMNCLSLLIPLWIKIYAPVAMESLKYEQKHTVKVNAFLKQFRGKNIICLHTWWAETAPDRFRANDNRVQLIEELNRIYWDKIIVFLSGTAFEEQGVYEILNKLSLDAKKHVVSICGKFNLFEFAYLLMKCNLMISNDTGPMHLAAAMGTKTIGLFGPNLPELFGPWPLEKNISLYKGIEKIFIKPHLGVFGKDTEDTINKITPLDVIRYVVF